MGTRTKILSLGQIATNFQATQSHYVLEYRRKKKEKKKGCFLQRQRLNLIAFELMLVVANDETRLYIYQFFNWCKMGSIV